MGHVSVNASRNHYMRTVKHTSRASIRADSEIQKGSGSRAGRKRAAVYLTLPKINCTESTLQIVQFMADHAYNGLGAYSCHHWATLKIPADSSKPVDTRWRASK